MYEDEVLLKEANKAEAKYWFSETFWYGLLIDVTVAVFLTLSVAVTNIEWTAMYWTTLGLSLTRTVIQSIVAYFMRRLVKPWMERRRNV